MTSVPLEEYYNKQRKQMVATQLVARGIRQQRVLYAMDKVCRHLFVSEALRDSAYMDQPLPLTKGQTISQPYIVAFMTELLALQGNEKVLEIGTGCGYQTAILAELAKEVHTIEIVEELALQAASRLQKLGYSNIFARCGDGYRGWVENAPFDAIIVTCGANHIPVALQRQMAIGGRMVIPVNHDTDDYQNLIYIEKATEHRFLQKNVLAVRFVPMTGEIRNRIDND